MRIWHYQLQTGLMLLKLEGLFFQGLPEELHASEEIKNAYLGGH